VLVNALALLAFTHDPTIFRFWRNEFDLEALNRSVGIYCNSYFNACFTPTVNVLSVG